jgi:hypothetical protein
MRGSQRFLPEDSLSSDDSDIDEMILQDRMAMKRRRGSVPGRITIPWNHAAGHEALMQDYFAEVPTYPPSPFVEGTECDENCL